MVVSANVGPVRGRFSILGGMCKLGRRGTAESHVAREGGHDRLFSLCDGGEFSITGVAMVFLLAFLVVVHIVDGFALGSSSLFTLVGLLIL